MAISNFLNLLLKEGGTQKAIRGGGQGLPRRQLESAIIWEKRKGLEQVHRCSNDIGSPPSKISRISSTPPQVGCKNMHLKLPCLRISLNDCRLSIFK